MASAEDRAVPSWSPRRPDLPGKSTRTVVNLQRDAQPLRIGQPYEVLMEKAVRRGESVGYGVPDFALGDCDGLVSEESVSPRSSSPAPDASPEVGGGDCRGPFRMWPSPELLSQAVEAARAYRRNREGAVFSSEARADDGEVSSENEEEAVSSENEDEAVGAKRKRSRGRKGGRNAPGKKAARNAGQGSQTGKSNSSHKGSKRRKKEAKDRAKNRPYERQHSASYFRRHRQVCIVSLETLDVVYDTTAYGYTHNRHGFKIKGRCWTDADIARAGYESFEWDGSGTHAIIDASDIVVGLLLGAPDDKQRVYWERYDACGPRLADAMKVQIDARPLAWSKGLGKLRGDFCSLSAGINYNFTEKAPANLVLDEDQRAVVDALLGNRDLQRVVGHASEGIAHFFPLPFDHARERMRRLHELLPHLDFPFDNSIYPAITFNGGPQTATWEHADIGNLPGFPCWVYPLGTYDPKKSARFIMHDLRLVVKFPPYRTIALSSAGVRHSNTALQPGETRYSIAGYMPGALMRYAAYGGNVAGLSVEDRARVDAEYEDSWVHQQARLSNFWELEEDREIVYRRERVRAVECRNRDRDIL